MMKSECVTDCYNNKYWFLNKRKHREDGPAVECANGSEEWWINGIEYIEEDFHKYWIIKQLAQI